jgi:hypothetical protein
LLEFFKTFKNASNVGQKQNNDFGNSNDGDDGEGDLYNDDDLLNKFNNLNKLFELLKLHLCNSNDVTCNNVLEGKVDDVAVSCSNVSEQSIIIRGKIYKEKIKIEENFRKYIENLQFILNKKINNNNNIYSKKFAINLFLLILFIIYFDVF